MEKNAFQIENSNHRNGVLLVNHACKGPFTGSRALGAIKGVSVTFWLACLLTINTSNAHT